MAIQSLGFALELFPNQRLPRYAGGTSVFSAPVASGGFTQFPSCKISTRPISTRSLIAAFSAKCSLAPASSVSGAAEHSSPRSLKSSSVFAIAPQAGKGYRTYHGRLSVGKRSFRQLLLVSPSPSLEGRIGSSFTCTLALPTSTFEFHGRRVRSVLYRILKLSTPFSLSWSIKKRRCVKLRVSRASACGIHYIPIHNRWLSTLHKYYVVTSSPVCLMEFNHIIANKLYRGFRGFHASSNGIGYFSTIRSLRSQAEGHGTPEKVMLVEEETNQEQLWSTGERKRDFLAVGYGWRVRDASLNNLQELVRVADIQTDAFHIPAAAFDDLFYKLFHAEVLSSLQYKARHSPPDRYSCLLAEKGPSQPGYIEDLMLNDENQQTIVGAVDATALMDSNIVSLLPGAYEYLYISGMAVDAAYRRRSVATLLLEACVARASEWGFKYLVLHAYEDDIAARTLYSRAGFRTVGGDPLWMTKFLGRRRRVVMARHTAPVPDAVPDKYPG